MTLADMISASQIAAIVTDPKLPDNPIVACNDAFMALTGYDRDEILGQNCRFLAGPDTDPAETQRLRDGVHEARPVLVEILNYKKDGTPFRNAVLVAPIFDDQGELEYFLGSQLEVQDAAGNHAEARRKAAREAIEALSPRQREVLVRMAAGKLNKQIAYELGITERTVKMHRSSVISSLGVKSSAEAIRMAVEAGY